MGLLDDAIREHLELKRRGGADPHEVAREEQEALQPIGIGELPAWALGPAQLEPLTLTPAEEAWAAEQVSRQEDFLVAEQPPSPDDAAPVPYPEPGQLAASVESELAQADQATVEIDMAALLAQSGGVPGDDGEPGGLCGEVGQMQSHDITVRRMAQQGSLELEAVELEWEDPPRRRAGTSQGEPAPPERMASE